MRERSAALVQGDNRRELKRRLLEEEADVLLKKLSKGNRIERPGQP